MIQKVGSTWILALLVTCLISTFTISAFAQGGAQGAIVVSVTDPTGAVVPNAQVEVINQDTGVTQRTVMTGSDGKVVVPLLPIGTYRVVITASGFTIIEAKDIPVRVTETTTVPVALQVGGITQEVSVTAAAVAVQTAAPTTGETLTAETVGTLPLSTRNFLTLLSLSAGANGELFDSANIGRGAVSVNVNGQRPVNNNYQLEGINANDVNLPQLDYVPIPNPQTIAEFKTQTAAYDASQGRNGGGNIQVSLKSGGNAYHGDAFEFFRNSVLNANDFFLNRAGQPRPVLRQNQFGGSLGGPVPLVKEFFFFGNYQGTRGASGLSSGTTLSTNIPILPTNRSAANLQSTFFPNGLPPGFTTLDPVAVNLLNLPASKCPSFNDGTYCIPSLAGTPGFATPTALRLGRITRSVPGNIDGDQFTITSDKSLGTNDKLSFRWFWENLNVVQPFGLSSTLAFAKGLPQLNRFAKISETRTLSAQAVNVVRFGFNRFGFDQVPTEPILLPDVGATRGNSAQFPATYRFNVTGSGLFSIGTGVNDNRGGRFNTFVYGDDFSYAFNKHTVRLGFEASQYQLNRYNNFATRGSVTFGNTVANDGGAGIPALIGFQNLLLGRVTGTQGGSGFFTFHFRAVDYAAYIQDDWRASSRLTVNLGLRWEGLSTAYEKNNFLSNLSGLVDGSPGPIQIIHPEQTPKVGTPGVSRCTLLHCLSTHNFAPRVGFALDLGDQKTVLRGGFGTYYQRVSNQSLLQTSGGLPFAQTISAAKFSVTPENPFPSILPASAFPLAQDNTIPGLVAFDGTTGAPVFNSAGGGPFSGVLFYPIRKFRPPYSYEWNLNVQREVYKGWVAEIGYVGTRGIRLLGTGAPLDPGQICTVGAPCLIPAFIGQGVTVPAGTPGVTKLGDGSIQITQSTAANVNARVPYKYLGLANNRGLFTNQAGQSTYHGLQATLSHQYNMGLYFQAAYTYSKSMDNASGSSFQDELNGSSGSWGDLLNTKSAIGLSDFDRTHRLVVSYNYELPFAKWAHIADSGLGRVASGWSINGVTVYQSGTPFMIYDSSALTLQDPEGIQGTNFAFLPPGVPLKSVLTSGNVRSRLNNYVDLTKFVVGGNCVDNQNNIVLSTSPACTGFSAIGNVARNQLRGPFQSNWDMSLIKTTKITERTSIDFRAEFFNVWNHAAFQSPQKRLGSPYLGNYGEIDISGGDSSILGTVNRPRIIQFAAKVNF
jgi:hypothetical protein